MKYTKEQLYAAYKNLPPEVRAAIGTDDRNDAYNRIMEEFHLTVKDASAISDEAAPVICGLVKPDEFVKNLRYALPNFSERDFPLLVKKIDEVLFAPIRQNIIHRPEQAAPKPDSQPPAITLGQPQGLEHTMSGDIAKTKLEQSFRIPPQNTTVKLGEEKQRPTSGIDPYREPIT